MLYAPCECNAKPDKKLKSQLKRLCFPASLGPSTALLSSKTLVPIITDRAQNSLGLEASNGITETTDSDIGYQAVE